MSNLSRDLCCLHLHKEEEALIHLKMYGYDPILPKLEKTPKSNLVNDSNDSFPSNLDEVDSFLSKATSEKPAPFIQMNEPAVPGLEKKTSRLRQDFEPYNSVFACDVNEQSPQRGEVH